MSYVILYYFAQRLAVIFKAVQHSRAFHCKIILVVAKHASTLYICFSLEYQIATVVWELLIIITIYTVTFSWAVYCSFDRPTNLQSKALSLLNSYHYVQESKTHPFEI